MWCQPDNKSEENISLVDPLKGQPPMCMEHRNPCKTDVRRSEIFSCSPLGRPKKFFNT